MVRGFGRSVLAGALLTAALAQAAHRADDVAEGVLQPYANVPEGRYMDASVLITASAPEAGTRRALRWRAALESNLGALIERPAALRGDYLDLGAEHSAWSRLARE